MLHLALKTEFSFKETFGRVSDIVDHVNAPFIGVADSNNTFAHIALETACKDSKTKPIYGVRLMVVETIKKDRWNTGPEYIFIAKNTNGLREIYSLVKQAWDNFYYFPKIQFNDVLRISEDVYVIAENIFNLDRLDYIALTSRTPVLIANITEIPKIAIINNSFISPEDRNVYQLLVGQRNMDNQTYAQHILTTKEWFRLWHDESAIENTYTVAENCNAELPSAKMIKFKGHESIEYLCKLGAKKRKVDIAEGTEYGDRYLRELAMIKKKDYVDYFLIVADIIAKAKKKMLVGPSRGSSAGALICWLLGITEVDPIEFGLLFERFIDETRSDLPDIDIDFPDKKRDIVLKDLVKTYGREHIRHIANINTMQARSAIANFAKELDIPPWETDAIKDAIIVRSGGDARAEMTMVDTFTTTDVGKAFIKEHPEMILAAKIEGHASHTGMHAAGIIICNEPIHHFVGINTRDDVAMVDKKGAKRVNLLKIDCLGLRTLTILEDFAKLTGMKSSEFYKLSFDDEEVFELFKNERFAGIFQFEGFSLQSVAKQMEITKFEDMLAITSLARPGALHSGGASRYAERRSGTHAPIYYSKLHKEITEETYGVVVYQEQMMRMVKDIGCMTWDDVHALRRVSSKSLGREAFAQYKAKFMEGAVNTHKMELKIAEAMWNDIRHSGNWMFNKSHAVAYAMISYWTAWAKVKHPLEFAVACLNNAKDENSALKLLRDLVQHDGIEYTFFDPDESQEHWTIHNGKLLGGLSTLKGIGPKKAKDIINRRENNIPFTPTMIHTLMNPESIFEELFPCQAKFHDFYEYPAAHGLSKPPSLIKTINGEGMYIFIGVLKTKNVRDLNQYEHVQKRGGEIYKTDSIMLNIIVEDDTDSLMCQVDRFHFEKMGRLIAETGVEGKDWYLIKGKISTMEWRVIRIVDIFHLGV